MNHSAQCKTVRMYGRVQSSPYTILHTIACPLCTRANPGLLNCILPLYCCLRRNVSHKPAFHVLPELTAEILHMFNVHKFKISSLYSMFAKLLYCCCVYNLFQNCREPAIAARRSSIRCHHSCASINSSALLCMKHPVVVFFIPERPRGNLS